MIGILAKENAYASGYMAAFYGTPKEKNPYVPFSEKWSWWNKGWDELEAEEQQNKVTRD